MGIVDTVELVELTRRFHQQFFPLAVYGAVVPVRESFRILIKFIDEGVHMGIKVVDIPGLHPVAAISFSQFLRMLNQSRSI